ncbi:hypothetical protein BpHYR1_046269, partial [Brachionus plicatilis]
RSNGKLKKAFIFCILENDLIGVKWIEAGDHYIKYIRTSQIALFFVIFFLFCNGIVNNYKLSENEFQECLKKKQDNWFDFYYKVKCKNDATLWNAFFKTTIDIAHYISRICGTIINSFMSSTFSGLGLLDIMKLIAGLTTALIFFKIVYM